MMKPVLAGICALALLGLASPLLLIQAQTALVAPRATGPFTYDAALEVTLTGTVSSVITKASAGVVPGAHLLLATLAGPVDVSLGTFGMVGKGALSLDPGQQVEVTGVMKTLKNSQVFLARTVGVDGKVYAIRNVHGVPVSPKARERARQNGRNGETL